MKLVREMVPEIITIAESNIWACHHEVSKTLIKK